MEADKEILDGFVVESREHLNEVEDELLAVEKQSGPPDAESINKIFRGIHTIKGGAGFLGLDKVNLLSHTMETLLSMVRSNELTADPPVLDALLSGVDLLRTMIDNVENQHMTDIADTVLRLDQLLTHNVSLEVQTHLQSQVSLFNRKGRETGFSINEFQLKKFKEENQELYLLAYDLNELRKTKSKSPLSVIRELEVVGDIVDGRIDSPMDDLSRSFKDIPLFYEVLFVSPLPADKLVPVIGVEPEPLTAEKINAEAEPPTPEPQVSQPPPAAANTPKPTAPAPPPPPRADPSDDLTGMPQVMGGKTETVRINVDLLDRLMNLAGELVLVRNQQLNNMPDFTPVLKSITQRLDLVTTEMQELIMLTRMQPIGTVLGKFPRFVRDLGKKLRKEIHIDISGNEVELDRTILESLSDPLTHIIRNCCDHGIELPEQRTAAGKPGTGTISIRVFHEAGQIAIIIEDDGQGIDQEKVKQKALERGLCTEEEISHMSRKEVFALLMQPGFSTAESISDVSGRGVGLDVVKSNIEKLNGNLDLKSEPGQGTTLNLKLPVTLAIIPSLIVRVGEDRFAIPQVNLEEFVSLYDEEALTGIECTEEREFFRLRGRLLPLVNLADVLEHVSPLSMETRAAITERNRLKRERVLQRLKETGGKGFTQEEEAARELNFAVLKVGKERFGLIIDHVFGTEEIVVKPMHSVLRPLKCYAGATVMGDGRVALIIDVEGTADHAGILGDFERDADHKAEKEKKSKITGAADERKLLVFKSGDVERFALDVTHIRRIEEIHTADIEKAGEREFITINRRSTPIIRLHTFLDVSQNIEHEEMYLVIPKHTDTPCGILVSELVDITECIVEMDTDSIKDKGLLGTAIVLDKMTLFPDLQWLTAMAERSKTIGAET